MGHQERFSKLKRVFGEDPVRWVLFLLPNALTTANLFLGYFSLIAASRGQWLAAAIAVLIAAFTDGLDGRVARMTKTQSLFGEQFDSMSDLVSFGAAPSFLIFHWALFPYQRLGWLASFLFLACAALRLARFNVRKQNLEKRYFQGCPSPVAAVTVSSAVLFFENFEFSPTYRGPFMIFVMFVLGATMISSLPYRSFKDLNFKSQQGFGYLLIFLVVILLLLRRPETYFFLLASVYVISGPLAYFYRAIRKAGRMERVRRRMRQRRKGRR